MSVLIGLDSISYEWPTKNVLSSQTIGIHSGDVIGIVGKNGDGKSTLLSLASKRLEPMSGQVTYRNGIQVGMLDQQDVLPEYKTVKEFLVGTVPEYEWASDQKIRSIFDNLLWDIDCYAKIAQLSGGQKKRVALAHLLKDDWDVLLLDEPTNHLDTQAITWLANYLTKTWLSDSKALLVVTHDRWFLDTVCNTMWEVHDQVIEPFEGGYSAYIQQRAERARLAEAKETKRQSILRKELAWLARGPQARTSKPKFRIEEAKALIADEPELRNSLELHAMAISRLGKQVIELKNATIAHKDKPLLNDIEFIIGPGDRIGLIGPNGIGKSSLLQAMVGKLKPVQGTIKIGKSVHFGILSQNLDYLTSKANIRVRELLQECKSYYKVDDKELTPRQLLERLGFETQESDTFIKDLSGGQKRRLAIMYVLLQEPNVLILDEPGNDLDTDMLAVFEDLLDSWPGTLILVSHDRYLMERVTDDQYAIENYKLMHMTQGIDTYIDSLSQTHRRSCNLFKDAQKSSQKEEKSQNALTNKERYQLKKKYDSISLKLSKISDEPAMIQQEMDDCDPFDFQKLASLQEKLFSKQEEIENLETEWLELSEMLGIE